MKYQKAMAEVIVFGPDVSFMTTSGGTSVPRVCGFYSTIDNTYQCFSIKYTGNQEGFAEEIVCSEIKPGLSPRTLWCSDIWDYSDYTVT